ncbi:hypothetical protein NDU88_004570 [Pleurodeles waltl]|uniref:Secreted protein n=1 Tax=Pleurodeles waltl TaxID=8319 RepID=A0AAV7MXW3_PLEWA|nr:hypothetical protein NDU88_004570 [Pleurodeles waltl]
MVCCFCWAGPCWANLGDLDPGVATMGRGKKGTGRHRDADDVEDSETARERHRPIVASSAAPSASIASCDLL